MFYIGNLNGPDARDEMTMMLQGLASAASAVLKEGSLDWVIAQLHSELGASEVKSDQLDELLLSVALRHRWLKEGREEGFTLTNKAGVNLSFEKGVEWVSCLQAAGALTPEVLDRGVMILELLGVVDKAPDVAGLANVELEGSDFCL